MRVKEYFLFREFVSKLSINSTVMNITTAYCYRRMQYFSHSTTFFSSGTTKLDYTAIL